MSSGGYYEVLGVAVDADAKTIKGAYRKLAREHHPDKNPGDEAAEERFKQITKAFEILSDPVKRKLYDEMGDDAERIGWDPSKAETYRRWARASQSQTPGSGGKGGGFDLGDILAGFQSGARAARPARGQDVAASLSLSFEDAIRGGRQRLTIQKPVVCTACDGQGHGSVGATACPECHGTGQTELRGMELPIPLRCASCGGSGRAQLPPCAECRGDGMVTVPSRIEVQIPPDVRDGQKIRLQGQGAPGRGSAGPGDLLLNVRVRPHAFVRRKGRDLELDLQVPMSSVLLGSTEEVKTLDGSVKVKVPAGAHSGQKLKVAGKGVPAARGRPAGDLLVRLRVRTPDPQRSPEAAAEAARWLKKLESSDPSG